MVCGRVEGLKAMRSRLLLLLFVAMLCAPSADAGLAAPFDVVPAVPPAPVRSATLAAYNGSVYAFGGTPCYQCDAVATILRFDPATGTWEEGDAAMPEGAFGMAAVTWGDRIYVFGGWKESGYSRRILEYDPSNDTLEELDVQLPTTRHHLGAVATPRSIYLFGGQGNYTTTCPERMCTDILRFDPVNRSVTTIDARLPSGADTVTAGTASGTVVVVLSESSRMRALVFDPEQEDFTKTGLPFTIRSQDMTAASFEDQFLVFHAGDGFPERYASVPLRVARVDPVNASFEPYAGAFEGEGGWYNGLMAAGAVAAGTSVYLSLPTENGLLAYHPARDVLVSSLVPAAPTDLRALAGPPFSLSYASSTSSRVRVEWTPPPTEIPVTSWEVLDVTQGRENATRMDGREYAGYPGPDRDGPQNVSFVVAAPPALHELAIAVRATNAAGTGPLSETITVAIPRPFDALPTNYFPPQEPPIWPGWSAVALLVLMAGGLVLARKRLRSMLPRTTAWLHHPAGHPAPRGILAVLFIALLLGGAWALVSESTYQSSRDVGFAREDECDRLARQHFETLARTYGETLALGEYEVARAYFPCNNEARAWNHPATQLSEAIAAAFVTPAIALAAFSLLLLAIALIARKEASRDRVARLEDMYAASTISGETRVATTVALETAARSGEARNVGLALGTAVLATSPVLLFISPWSAVSAAIPLVVMLTAALAEGRRGFATRHSHAAAEDAWQRALEEGRTRSQPARASPPSRFRVIRELGRGTSARAVLALDTILDRRVVLKQPVAPWLVHDEAARARFLREARLAARIHHPRVVSIYEILPHEFPPVLVMEYVAGGTAEEALAREGALPLARALAITRDVLEGLAAVHGAGMVHCDVKPSNILLDEDGRAKVGDFDITRAPADYAATAPLGARAGSIGTLATASPEQLRGDAVDARSDIYATGAVLYRLATGQHYLDLSGMTDFRIRLAVQECPPLLVTTRLTREVLSVVERALEKNPDARFQTASEMLQALERASTVSKHQERATDADHVTRP